MTWDLCDTQPTGTPLICLAITEAIHSSDGGDDLRFFEVHGLDGEVELEVREVEG